MRAGGTSRPDRVFLVGYYGFDNLGDDAIRTAIEGVAAESGVTIDRYATRAPSHDPRAVPATARGAWRYLRAILASDRVVLGGGGILKDEGLRLPIELFGTALIARLARREVTLAGVGVGPFYTRLGRWLVAVTARLASVRTVRDEASAAALRALGISGVEVGADPIFALGAASGSDIGVARDPAATRRAVVSIRPWYPARAHSADERRAALRRALGSGIRDLVDAGWDVHLVALHWPRDRDEAVRVVEEAGLAGRVEIVDRRLDWPSLEALVASADLVVTMRYHCLAAAALAGRPTIALAYEPKVASLGTRIGVPVLDVDASDLAEQLRTRAEQASADPGTFTPDGATVVELREAARRIVARALLGRQA